MGNFGGVQTILLMSLTLFLSAVKDYTEFSNLEKAFKSTDSSVLLFLKAMLHIDGRERKSAKELIQFEFVKSNMKIVEGLRSEHMMKDFEAMRQQLSQIQTQHQDEMKQMETRHEDDMKKFKDLVTNQLSQIESKHQDELQQLKGQMSRIQQDASKTVEKPSKTELELETQTDKLEQLQEKLSGRQREEPTSGAAARPQALPGR